MSDAGSLPWKRETCECVWGKAIPLWNRRRGLLFIATPQLSEAGWSSDHVIGAGGSGSSEALLKLLYVHTLTYVYMSACIRKHFHSQLSQKTRLGVERT